MLELNAVYQVGSPVEAIALLEEHGERARVLAGGTSLVLGRSSRVEVLIDLSRAGLDQMEKREDGLHLGAMVRCSALRRFLAQERPTALAEAAASIGSRILQNHVTVGGNSVMVYAWSDLPVALLCHEASFIIQGRGNQRRTITADAFFAEHPTRSLAEAELLVEVVVPQSGAGQGSAYLKTARDATDQALASVAARVTLEGQRIRQARVVVGAVRGLPQVLADVAESLLGQAPEAALYAAAGELAAREAKVSEDYRASAEYRAVLVAAMVEQALEVAVGRAGGNR